MIEPLNKWKILIKRKDNYRFKLFTKNLIHWSIQCIRICITGISETIEIRRHTKMGKLEKVSHFEVDKPAVMKTEKCFMLPKICYEKQNLPVPFLFFCLSFTFYSIENLLQNKSQILIFAFYPLHQRWEIFSGTFPWRSHHQLNYFNWSVENGLPIWNSILYSLFTL